MKVLLSGLIKFCFLPCVAVVVNGSSPEQKMLGIILTVTAQGANDSETLGSFDVSNVSRDVSNVSLNAELSARLFLQRVPEDAYQYGLVNGIQKW